MQSYVAEEPPLTSVMKIPDASQARSSVLLPCCVPLPEPQLCWSVEPCGVLCAAETVSCEVVALPFVVSVLAYLPAAGTTDVAGSAVVDETAPAAPARALLD